MLRKCYVIKNTYGEIPLGNFGKTEHPAIEAIFHQFSIESDYDGITVTVAVVEYADGSISTVPLHWLKMLPMEHVDD